MNEKDDKLNKGSFLYINDEEKAEWGQPEGYPYKEDNRTIIEWDGNTNGKETFGFGNISNPFKFYKVSDVTVSAGDLLGAALSYYIASIDRSVNITVTSDLITDYSEYGTIMIMNPENKEAPLIVIILDSEKTAASGINASEGIYFFSDVSSFINMLTYGSETIHPIAPDFLPQANQTTYGAIKKAAHVPHVTAAPTSNDFNKLLSALREAEIMSQSE